MAQVNSSSKSRGRSRSFFAPLVVGFAFFAFVACYNGIVALTLNATGVVTDARVVEVVRGQRGSTVTVEYTTDGGEVVRAECGGCDPDLVLNDRVQIRYDPRFTSSIEAKGNQDHQRVFIVGLVIMVAFAVPAVVTGRKLLKERGRRNLPL